MDLTIADVEQAAARLQGAVARTPFLRSLTLSELTGADIWLKFENLQFTASFKERGALNKLLTLDAEARRRGVVAVSAGNHAQGVALHARRLGIPATIVMPSTTPAVKVSRTASFGARIELVGADLAAAMAEVPRFVEQGMTFVHPFDDPVVAAGQGTVALEMLDQGPPLDAVVVAIGGGGLASGVATVFKARSPATEVIGVQGELYPSMALALGWYDGVLTGGSSVAEGIAVARPGDFTLCVTRERIDDVVVVSEALMEDAVAMLLQIEKTLCEGAGAAGLAAVFADPSRFRGQSVGLILSGGNIDMRVLTAMLQRHLARAGQLIRLSVVTPDNAGLLGTVATAIGQFGGNIVEVSHDRVFGDASARSASMMFTVELPGRDRIRAILSTLDELGFDARLLDPQDADARLFGEVA